MGHLSRRAAVMVATPILALGILVGGSVASASPTGRNHGPDHVALTTGRNHGPDHVALTTGRNHGPDHVALTTGRDH